MWPYNTTAAFRFSARTHKSHSFTSLCKTDYSHPLATLPCSVVLLHKILWLAFCLPSASSLWLILPVASTGCEPMTHRCTTISRLLTFTTQEISGLSFGQHIHTQLSAQAQQGKTECRTFHFPSDFAPSCFLSLETTQLNLTSLAVSLKKHFFQDYTAGLY